MGTQVIEIESLTKSYGKARGIENVSLSIEEGEILGFIGPFKYVSLDTINPGYRLELWRVFYFLGLSLLLISVSFRVYKRKDIYL